MSAAVWKKITKRVKGEDVLEAEPYLEIREGKYKTAFRVRYRQGGIMLEERLDGFTHRDQWKEAEKAAKIKVLEAETGAGKQPKPEPAVVRTETVLDEIVKLKRSEAAATYEQIETIVRLHVKPFLNGLCAYEEEEKKPCSFREYIDSGACPLISGLNATHFLNYKTHFRMHRPQGRLFNHWKVWVQLAGTAHDRSLLVDDKGQLRPKPRFAFNEKKEDPKEPGKVIPDVHLTAFLACANQTWKDRSLLQKLTIQRPGVIRKLRKDQYDPLTRFLKVKRLDSKNRTVDYGFLLPRAACEILDRRLLTVEGPYFFPNERNSAWHMGKTLTGWHSAWDQARDFLLEQAKDATRDGNKELAIQRHQAAASIPAMDSPYTPHDLRHTELTRRFKIKGADYALICYQADLSLEMAMETYIHFTPEDTRPVAEESDQMAAALLSMLPARAGALPAEVRARIMELRAAGGHTWNALAEAVGITRQSFMKYLTEDVQVGPITARRLVRLNEFFADAKDQNPLRLPPWIWSVMEKAGMIYRAPGADGETQDA